MREGIVVLIKYLKLEGVLMSRAIDTDTGKIRCVIYCDDEHTYIVDESDLVFVGTLEESLKKTLQEDFINAWNTSLIDINKEVINMSEEKEEKRLYPGDVGYKGGTFSSTVYVDGKVKEVKTVKDANGNVVAVYVSNKILGIF